MGEHTHGQCPECDTQEARVVAAISAWDGAQEDLARLADPSGRGATRSVQRQDDGTWYWVWGPDFLGDIPGRSLHPESGVLEEAYQRGRSSVEERREADVERVAGMLTRGMVELALDDAAQGQSPDDLGKQVVYRMARYVVERYRAPLPSRETLVAALWKLRIDDFVWESRDTPQGVVGVLEMDAEALADAILGEVERGG